MRVADWIKFILFLLGFIVCLFFQALWQVVRPVWEAQSKQTFSYMQTETPLQIFVPICKYKASLFVLRQKVEGRVASDQELKLTELLRYYMRDIQAAKVKTRAVCLLSLLSMHKVPFSCSRCTKDFMQTIPNWLNFKKKSHLLILPE